MLRIAVRFEQQIRYFPFPEMPRLLGSAADSDIRLPFPGISRHHAELSRHQGALRVRDLGSKNGLLRGGVRHDELLLGPGELLQIGRAWMAIEEISTADDEVGLSLPAAAIRLPPAKGHANADTASLADEPTAVSPSGALAWVRSYGTPLRSATASAPVLGNALAAARRVLGARCLFACGLGDDGPAVLQISGPPPADGELAAAEQGARNLGGAGTVAQALGDDQALLIAVSVTSHGPLAVGALLATTPTRIAGWQHDFLEHLAALLATADPARPAAPSPAAAPARPPLAFPPDFVVGESPAFQGLLEHLRATMPGNLDVVILGETGTGKEIFARMAHASGPTADGPFVAMNCAAIPAELLEAELFGVEARVATGVDPRPGLFLQAEGGSIFLDEIGDMPDALQAKVLRTLQEREVLPLGGRRPRKIRVRVISASNKDLPRLVQEGRFRADLYYRLRGLQFHLPPLRERREDIPALVLHFSQRAAATYHREIRGVSRRALALLTEHDWPGNIRELEHEVERAVLLCSDGGTLESTHFGPVRYAVEHRAANRDPLAQESVAPAAAPLASDGRPAPGGAPRGLAAPPAPSLRPLQVQVDELERRAISEALAVTAGNKSRAAKLLGLNRNGLAMKMRRLGVA
jgi:DNA-binding NtrC family response regulator